MTDDMIGQHFGQYLVGDRIGKGGMATVYRATQESIGREVAIKFLPKKLTHEDQFLERFNREVQISASLQHPHIIPIYDFGQFDEQPYIVMGHYTGGTLADILDERTFDLDEVIEIVRQAASALDYAHGKGILHRDIKPSNFLLDDGGNVYLADFGLARVVDSSGDLTQSGIVGTPAYIAPELGESSQSTHLADIYSLGIMIFQLLSGQVPFDADSPFALLVAHMTHPVPDIRQYRPDVPERVQLVLERAMAKKPEHRFQSAAALADALAAAPGSTTAVRQVKAAPGLLFIDPHGKIIFVDSGFLQLTHRQPADARFLVGQNAASVLGIDAPDLNKLIKEIEKIGQIRGHGLTIIDARDDLIDVALDAMASYDEKGVCIGIDLTVMRGEGGAPLTPLPGTFLDTSDRLHMDTYFTAQLDALRVLMTRWGGAQFSRNLENLVNETAERRGWTFNMQESKISIEVMPEEGYRALLAKAVGYASKVLGEKTVVKQIQAVEDQLGEYAPALTEQFGLLNIFTDRI